MTETFLLETASPLSKGLDDRPPPSSQGLNPALQYID